MREALYGATRSRSCVAARSSGSAPGPSAGTDSSAGVAHASHALLKIAPRRTALASTLPPAMLVESGEVPPVLQLSTVRRRVRPWIAMAAAYALALQLLFTGIAAAHAVAASDAPDLFVICHGSGDGPAGDADG